MPYVIYSISPIYKSHYHHHLKRQFMLKSKLYQESVKIIFKFSIFHPYTYLIYVTEQFQTPKLPDKISHNIILSFILFIFHIIPFVYSTMYMVPANNTSHINFKKTINIFFKKTTHDNKKRKYRCCSYTLA